MINWCHINWYSTFYTPLWSVTRRDLIQEYCNRANNLKHSKRKQEEVILFAYPKLAKGKLIEG